MPPLCCIGRLALLVSLVATSGALPAAAGTRTVVLLLFDGFPPAAVAAHPTPALDRMRREGASSDGMEPPFPSISLVSQVTISTGCWPAHHGIVANQFLDPERGVYDHDSDADWLTGCEHLHQVAQRQGVTTAALGWVGRRSKSRGPQARIVGKEGRSCADSLVATEDAFRGDEVSRLLLEPPEVRPGLVVAYFCGPDMALHREGPDAESTARAVVQSDSIVERVMQTIDRLPDRESISLLVTTDHGMGEARSIVNVRRILGRLGVAARVFSGGTTAYLYLDDPAQADAVAASLADRAELEVLRKGALPAYAHLGDGPRVPDLILSAHPPYFIEDVDRWPSWLHWLADWGPDSMWARFSLVGAHGHPPDVAGMHGIFYAWGAGIARARTVERVRAIDIHPTVAHLLGIEPGQPVDGRIERATLAEEPTP